MMQRRDFIYLGGALAGTIVLPVKLPRQWFVTSISGYVIRLKKGESATQWLREIEDDYPNLKEVTGNVFWGGPAPVSAEYRHWPRWKHGDGQL